MEHFEIYTPAALLDELTNIMLYYDYRHTIKVWDKLTIGRNKESGMIEYDTTEKFLLGEIFYKTKKELHYYHLEKGVENDTVCNFNLTPHDFVIHHPLLNHLMRHPVYEKFIYTITNYGTFIRFSENKVQRLYWNPAINAGIPLTAKEKDPVYELIFLMHDFGHFLLPDLVPTGNNDILSQKFYVNWRLLGESITVVLNEMLLVDYLKDKLVFKSLLKQDYDKPYKLYQIFKPIKLKNKTNLKKLFNASYLYFCIQDPSGFLELIDRSIDNWEAVWTEFDARYRPVALRGREWTESNYSNIEKMSSDYAKWYRRIKNIGQHLEFVTIDEIIPSTIGPDISDRSVMDILFDQVWHTTLYPLFFVKDCPDMIPDNVRRLKSFYRYMAGNVFLLLKYPETLDLGEKIISMMDFNKAESVETHCKELMDHYLAGIKLLYDLNKITINEYHNYKNIFIMIPPNILKKDVY